MILDERTEFADAVSVAAAAGTAQIGDLIDLGSIARDIGAAEHLYLVISVDTEIITGGAAGTIEFLLASDAQSPLATDGSATVHWRSGTLVTDDSAANSNLLNAGSILAHLAIPLSGNVYERYLGILCIIGTTTVTAGAISAYLTPDKHTNPAKHYAEGVN